VKITLQYRLWYSDDLWLSINHLAAIMVKFRWPIGWIYFRNQINLLPVGWSFRVTAANDKNYAGFS